MNNKKFLNLRFCLSQGEFKRKKFAFKGEVMSEPLPEAGEQLKESVKTPERNWKTLNIDLPFNPDQKKFFDTVAQGLNYDRKELVTACEQKLQDKGYEGLNDAWSRVSKDCKRFKLENGVATFIGENGEILLNWNTVEIKYSPVTAETLQS